MKKGKRVLTGMLLMLCVALCAGVLAACSFGGNNEKKPEPTRHTHTLNHVDAVAPDCETAGNREYWVCEECGKYFADQGGKSEIKLAATVIGKLGHRFTNYVSDNNVTCTADGTKTAKCERCDATDTVKEEALGHSFVNYVSDKNATCTADGTKTAKCERCD